MNTISEQTIPNAPSADAAAPGAMPRRYRPSLNFYHANAKGTGCALQFELHPAHDDTDGSIMLAAASQASVGDFQSGVRVYPRFDWANKIVVKLDFSDLARMLQVFRGECEALGDEGRGLFHAMREFSTRIVLRHILDPIAGYSLELYRSYAGGAGERRTHILLTPWEALGLSEAIAGSLAIVSFGIPVVIPRVARGVAGATEGVRHAAA